MRDLFCVRHSGKLSEDREFSHNLQNQIQVDVVLRWRAGGDVWRRGPGGWCPYTRHRKWRSLNVRFQVTSKFQKRTIGFMCIGLKVVYKRFSPATGSFWLVLQPQWKVCKRPPSRGLISIASSCEWLCVATCDGTAASRVVCAGSPVLACEVTGCVFLICVCLFQLRENASRRKVFTLNSRIQYILA